MGVAIAVEAAKATAMIKGSGLHPSLAASSIPNGAQRTAAGLFKIKRLKAAAMK